MAMGTQRSKALHNFTMPGGLRWGNQRFLRCMKVNSNGQISPLNRFTTNTSDHRNRHPIQQRRTTRDREGERDKNSSPVFVSNTSDDARKFSNSDDGIAAMREKVILDLQSAADKMKHAIFKDGLEEPKHSVTTPPPLPPPPPPPAVIPGDGVKCRPWNLRTRRTASKTSAVGVVSDCNDGSTDAADGKDFKADLAIPDSGLQIRTSPAAATILKSPIHKADVCGTSSSVEKKERAKFSVSLSKREIEEDFFEIVRHRPPRRPRKRAKFVQRELDTLFPGLFLTEVNSDMYKVLEASVP